MCRSRRIGVQNGPITLKFDIHLCSIAAEMHAKFQSNIIISTHSHASLSLHQILWYDILSLYELAAAVLTHWGRVTHICISKLTIIGSDNVLSPDRRQAIIWTNVGILLIGPLGTNFSEMFIVIQTFSFKKKHLKVPSEKWRPFCLGLNVLIHTSMAAWETYCRQHVALVYCRKAALVKITHLDRHRY